MKLVLSSLTGLALLTSPTLADPWKDEGRWRDREYAGYDREYEEEFWVGNCKIERKWERNGEYEEERKCESPSDD
jgi:hypothetical protein